MLRKLKFSSFGLIIGCYLTKIPFAKLFDLNYSNRDESSQCRKENEEAKKHQYTCGLGLVYVQWFEKDRRNEARDLYSPF